ncbi:MAG TPA: hypothetical protein ENH62_10105 [Marinobacter sp.]|uniref:Uncharacterized protein n=1 Tax=marine sediment metagenome TaxID=412755 RepID=A0A0F9LU99_9ZZZZ|nr:hypothetical protein [Marinobacter sp.]
MARLTFATIRRPKPLKFWTPTKGYAHLTWLPNDEFEAMARKYGVDPAKGAFTVKGGGWWQKPKIITRATHLRRLIIHEAHHVEEPLGENFHED